MTDLYHTTIENTIKLDGVLWPIIGQIGFRDLARIENRIVTGDPSKDDDELLSTKVWSDFSGGCGIYDEREGADTGTFWDCEGVDIDHPQQLALAPKVVSFGPGGGTQAYVLGLDEEAQVIAAVDLHLYKLLAVDDSFADAFETLNWTPVNKGVQFNGILWIPLGANGYQVYTNAGGVDVGDVAITAVAFAVWDNKLVAIEDTGQLSIYNPVTLAWTSPATAKLTDVTVRDIVVYPNRSDEPSIYVMTTVGLFGYDEVTQTFKATALMFEEDADLGKGLQVWRSGESLHVSAGMGIYSWTGPGGVASPVGLDRRQGVPAEYQGTIIDLEASNNHLWALIQGNSIFGYHSLYRFNGSGWARMWSGAATPGVINWCVSAVGAGPRRRIWWAVGPTIYGIEWTRDFSNPREINRGTSGNFDTTEYAYLITSWFDANMQAFDKLNVYYYQDVSGCDGLGNSFITDFQENKEFSTWSLPAYSSADGLVYELLNLPSPLIRARFQLGTGTPTATPVLDSAVLKYMKVPTSVATFQVTFDLGFEGMKFDRDAQKMARDLKALLVKRTLILAEINQNQYYLRVSNVQGWDSPAEDRRKSRTVTFVQIPTPTIGQVTE